MGSRFAHRSRRGLKTRSAKYITAARKRGAARIESAPSRRRFPKRWRLNLQKQPQGKIIYIRRTNDKGRVNLLGHTFAVDRHWLHRLVRAEVDLDADQLRLFALRRREPTDQPLLNQAPYTRDILRQFLVEAIVLCLIGGLIGIGVGRGCSLLVRGVMSWPTEPSLAAIAAAVAVSLTVGVAFGYYPAWKASRLNPIEALRYE